MISVVNENNCFIISAEGWQMALRGRKTREVTPEKDSQVDVADAVIDKEESFYRNYWQTV
jgi:hypothetical protein